MSAIAEKEEKIELEGEVTEALRNGMFRITLDNGHRTIGYTSGKMRRYRIRILPGDRIKIELSPYDLDRGRITYRYKGGPAAAGLTARAAPARRRTRSARPPHPRPSG